MNVNLSGVDESCKGKAGEVSEGEELLEEPRSFIGKGISHGSVLGEVAHDGEDSVGNADGSSKRGEFCELVVDSLSIDAGHEEAVGCEADGADNCHFGGILGDGHVVDPPLDEEELQEVDE